MAGNSRSGRKPSEQPETLDPNDRPLRPDGLDADALELWDKVIIGAVHLRKVDSQLCQSCCEAWSLYRRSLEIANKDPINKDARIAVTTYWQQWKVAMQTLGLDPLGRLRLKKTTKRAEKGNPLAEFGIVG